MKGISFALFLLIWASNGVAQGIDSNSKKELAYRGYWRFVKEDFRDRHPFLPFFMVNKALNTRLFLGDHFIQYKTPKTMVGEARTIEKVERLKEDHFLFKRREDGEVVEFELYQKNEKWYYREGDLHYQVLKDNLEDQKRWREKNS